ncbi:hypothetical protein BT93_L1560 [Corymbia citriodora subsp. variegata]|uniref:EF-hand domain-containing protein n=1 Tax=Corymbia citriodora subsp. variegata TaxID=360336 RepID=A0A8T0CPS6_CORYI|nr:hypothetical protein BT93_L1560 [Corymbia citriodora subsp. variegata]
MDRAVVHLPKWKNPPLADSFEKLKEVFRRSDANGDGRLNWAELKNAFQRLGVPAPRWRAILAIHHADENGDGCISEHELDALLQFCLEHGYIVVVPRKSC